VREGRKTEEKVFFFYSGCLVLMSLNFPKGFGLEGPAELVPLGF